MTKDTVTASQTPVKDIERISYPGQPKLMKLYKSGYESFFNRMPIINPIDKYFRQKLKSAKQVMQQLAERLTTASWITAENVPGDNEFVRTILGIEPPSIAPDGSLKEGSEIVLAKWGDGFTSPVHGHASGYIHEDIIFGKMRVNMYRRIDPNSNRVRIVRTDIVKRGTFVSEYREHDGSKFMRPHLIHNFTSIGLSASLHFLPEHTRDGRDNKFDVEYFEDVTEFSSSDFERIDAKQGMYLRPGDVALVRSQNVPEYGDHYIVVTGHPIIKEHGMRPQEIAIHTPHNWVLNQYEPHMGLILLKLKPELRDAFLEFHGITIQDGTVIFPEA